MSILALVKSRLASRTDSEHEQAVLRIVIVGLIWAYMGLFADPASPEQGHFLLVSGLSVFFAIAIAIFTCIVTWPAPNVARRIVGMVADTAGATFYMCLGAQYGTAMIAVYLFVTFGNGFRFGRRHLFICQALSLIGLVAVLAFVPFWKEHRPIGVGLLISLIVLPLYVSTLLKRIHEARQRAEEANQAKTAFLANMSHEMRTPLNGIVGAADLLSTTLLTHHQSELVRHLRHSVKVLRSLVDDVLDITKIEAGRLTLEVVSFDLYLTIGELVELLRPNAEEKRLQIASHIDPHVQYWLNGDPHHLRQVLLNLLGNAIKFTDEGEVSLNVSRVSCTSGSVRVRFEVRDTGIGIPEEAIGRIFERFVQADQSTTRRFGGTGLGTTIAKQLVEHMGGTIGVESEAGVGSTFWFELPFSLAPAASAPRETHALERSVVVLVSALDCSKAMVRQLEVAGESCVLVDRAQALPDTVARERKAGKRLRAIIAFDEVEPTCATFAAANSIKGSEQVALIHIAPTALSVVDHARIASIGKVMLLQQGTDWDVIANAIHAANIDLTRADARSRTLAQVLEGRRASATILVADDNLTNQAIIKELLQRAGHKVLLASDGERALDLYESDRPDLALLDFNMPQRTGCEVIKAIRILETPNERMPAIVLSASVTQESRDRAIKSGADAFVGKPFDAEVLLNTIDQLIQRARETSPAYAAGASVAPHRKELMVRPECPINDNVDDDFTSPLVNWNRVAQLEDIARNPGFITELMRGFKDDAERLLLEIDLSTNSNDRVALGDAIHALKGAAVGIGAVRLAEQCAPVEAGARTDGYPSVELREAANRLRSVYSSTLESLHTYMLEKHHIPLLASN